MIQSTIKPTHRLIAGICGLLLVLVGCTSPVSGTTSAAATATNTPTSIPPSATPIPRSVVIRSLEGSVEVRTGPDAPFSAATVGQSLVSGNELRTGADGKAMLLLDDGTVVAVASDTSFTVGDLKGTHETPITRFLMSVGQVFNVTQQPLPEGASYEVETPSSVATIRGSMMGVRYSEEKGSEITCLIGSCAASSSSGQVELEANKWVSIDPQGTLSDVADMTGEQKHEWGQVLKDIENAGIPVQSSGDLQGCTCQGPDLVCPDGTTNPSFPTCTAGPQCECQGADLVCNDGNTQSNDPACTGGASSCSCDGANLYCDNGTVQYNSPACTGGAVCLCDGPDLKCDNGTVYPSDPACVQDTSSCTCTEGFLVCPDGSYYFNTPGCSSDLPCSCQGTSLVCTVEGTTVTYPNNPMCGGGGSDCFCVGTDLYCSDGSVTPGSPSCAGAPALPPLPPIPPSP